MANIGYATLSVIPSMRGAAAALTSESGTVGTSAATAFSGGFNRVLSGGLIAAGVVAATGASLLAIGSSFDDAYDTIQAGTGATGDALEGLKDVFRDVVADVPTDFASASEAISLLNQRLELTGRPLEQLSEQFLELSRITDTDLTGNIDSVTRAFGDWSVATEDQSEVLDRFFRASQDSGVAVSELAEGVVQFGSPLRQLGFSLDESIALFASFGEAGVNTSTVMSGMRQAVKNFASGLAENELGVRNFGDVLEGVRDGTFDLSDAMTLFGARAGADMFAAIQEGRFDLEDFLGAMRDTQGGIMDTAEDTRDFGESFQILKNNIALLLEGPATRFMDWLSDAAVALADFSAKVSDEGWGSALGDMLDQWRDAPGVFQLASGAVVGIAIAFVAVKIQAGLAWLAALGPIGGFIALAAIVGVAIYTLANNWDWAGDRAGHVSDVIEEGLGRMPGQTAAAGEAFGTLTGTIQDTDQAASDLDLTGQDLAGTWEFVRTTWSDSWEGIKSIVQNGVDNIGNLVRSGMEGVKSLWNSAWSSVKGQVLEAWEGIKSTVRNGINTVVSFLTALPGRAVSAVASMVSGLTNKGREAMQGMFNAIRDVWGNISGWLGGLPGRIVSAVGSLASVLYNAGASAIRSLWDGMRSVADGMIGWAQGIADTIGGILSGLNPFESASLNVTTTQPVGPALSAFPTEAVSSRYSGQQTQTRVVVEANGVDSALVEWLRRSVRVESGGNVQAFLGA